MKDRIETVLTLLFVVVVFGGVIWLNYSNYNECRTHGFSVMYCISGHR